MTGQICQWLQDAIYKSETEAKLISVSEMDNRIKALPSVFNPRASVESLKEAMTTAHFSTYFSASLSREFFKAYESKPSNWRKYTYADTAPDFRPVDRFRKDTYIRLYRRREKGENTARYMTVSRVYYSVYEWGAQEDISWQTLLNDDLGELKKIPADLAAGAIDFENDWVSNLYDNATTQATVAALGAPWAGTGRLTAANLAIGLAAMRTRTRPDGRPLAVNRVYLVIPPDLEIQAKTILKSQQMAGVATNDVNVLNEFMAGYFIDPYIATAAPNIPWYLFADPADIPAVPVARLVGAPGPLVYMKEPDIKMLSGSAPSGFELGSFATGDIEYGVSTFIGGWADASYIGLVDARGFYYSSGTTP